MGNPVIIDVGQPPSKAKYRTAFLSIRKFFTNGKSATWVSGMTDVSAFLLNSKKTMGLHGARSCTAHTGCWLAGRPVGGLTTQLGAGAGFLFSLYSSFEEG